jgi:hypothetical protein
MCIAIGLLLRINLEVALSQGQALPNTGRSGRRDLGEGGRHA